MEPDITLKDFLKQVLEPVIDDCVARALNKALNTRALEPESASAVFDLVESAKYLKLSKSTVYSLARKRILPHFKQGRHMFFRKEELDKWLESGRVETDDFNAAAGRYRTRINNRI